MKKLKQAAAGIATLLGVAAFSLPAAADHGGHGGHVGRMGSVGYMGGHEHFGGGHGGHWRGGGWGWGPGVGIYLGNDDDYYDDGYGNCYWRYGRRFCRY